MASDPERTEARDTDVDTDRVDVRKGNADAAEAPGAAADTTDGPSADSTGIRAEGSDTDPNGSQGPRRQYRPSDRRLLFALVVGVVLVATGALTASWITTAGGDVAVSETTIETESGLQLEATVYEPAESSAEEPAPAVLLIHGYTGERGTMAGFATELADRGYVAVAVDQPGHGGSDPPAFADDWGGPASLDAVRGMETVDPDRIALVGHSMGGFASLAAAEAHPAGYRSVVLVGSTWSYADAPEADATFPRNLAVLFSPYDEFAPLMWNESVPGDVAESEKLAAAFGTEPPVEPRETYGSIDAGTGRYFEQPRSLHAAQHLSPTTVGATVDWVVATTDGPAEPPGVNQRWYWAALGRVGALVGGLVAAVAATAFVWRRLSDGETRPAGPDLDASPVPTDDGSGGLTRGEAIALTAIPALSIYPLYAVGTAVVPVTRLTHMQLAHGTLAWALGGLALAAGVVRWRRGGVDHGAIRGIVPDRSTATRSVVAALAGVTTLAVLVAVAHSVPGGGLRAWVVGVGPISGVRWLSLAIYGLPTIVAGMTLAIGLERLSQLPRASGRPTAEQREADGRGTGGWRETGHWVALTCGGLVVFLAIQYLPLVAGYGMAVPELGPLAIVATGATAQLALATAIVGASHRLTGSPYPGGMLAGVLFAWLVVGTTPIDVAPL